MTWLAYSHLGVPKRVTLTQQPGGAKVNVPFTTQPIAKLVDGSGVLARVQDVSIVASKVAGTGTLSGTTTIPTVDGISAFTNLQMDTVTATVTLGFASSGLTSVNATPFNVTTTQFTLGAVGTSYAISGTAVGLLAAYRLTTSAGSYALTGSDATLLSDAIFRLAASSYIAASAATATTARLTAPSGKTSGADFQAGLISDDTNPLPTLDLGSGKYTELEWCLMASSALSVDDVYQFRVVKSDNTALDTYSLTPAWTIASQSGTFNMVASPGSYALTGTAAALTYYTPYKVMTASPAIYAWTGSDVTLTYSGGSTLTYDGSYISTYEPVDANTLMADDFSRGHWYTQDYDTASNGGTLYNSVNNLGWGGTIYANPITPAGAIVGGGVGLHGRQYAATSGYHTGAVGGRNMADHGFLGGVHVNEAYFRVYFQYQSDYNGGHEKQFDFTRGSGTGALVALGYNYFGSNTFRYIPYLHQDDGLGSNPGNAWMGANLTSNINEVNGHWYYLEMRVVMNTPGAYDGIYEFWMDDCGTDGTGGPGTPTKRGSYTDVKYRDTGAEASVDLGGIWIENWANEATTGTIYYANVYVSKAFVGFANPAHQP